MRFLIVLISLFAAGCTGLCGSKVEKRIASPSGQMEAVVFTRDCGATTGSSTQISIVPRGKELPNGPGNAFIAQDRIDIVPQWTAENQLVIIGTGIDHRSMRKSMVEGIAIEYERRKL